MTRLLMTTDTVGGVWTYSLELADALAAHDVEVELATMGRPMSDAQRDEVGGSAVRGVHESAFALEWTENPWTDVDRAAAWLLELEDDLAPDVVHLNGYAHAALPWRAPTVVVAHSCLVSWWEAVHAETPPSKYGEYRRRVKAGLDATRLLVAPTMAMLDAVRRCYAVEGGIVIPNCRRHDAVAPAHKERCVLAAGRLWDEAKNVAALDRVAATLNVPVRIAGDARHPAGGRDWVPQGAELLGWQPFSSLSVLMASAAIFALPARYEPFGLAALEAAQAGCALVLGDIPSLREVWGDAATYVDPDDDAALARALRRLLDDEAHRAAMAARARLRARTYAPERTAACYVDAYRKMAETAGSVP
jgi:glycogen synthase